MAFLSIHFAPVSGLEAQALQYPQRHFPVYALSTR